jgi:hypothetical protein
METMIQQEVYKSTWRSKDSRVNYVQITRLDSSMYNRSLAEPRICQIRMQFELGTGGGLESFSISPIMVVKISSIKID